jgi:hypothetical protein
MSIRPVVLVALAAAALLAGAPAARAEGGFRCGNRVVSEGDHMVDVRRRCGDPDFVAQRVEQRKVKSKVRRRVRDQVGDHEEEVSEERIVDVVIDQWTYDLGPERFVRYVDFEDARVLRVTTGDYGSRSATSTLSTSDGVL